MLVEDLMRKTEIIQSYVRDTKTGLFTVSATLIPLYNMVLKLVIISLDAVNYL